MMYL